MAINRKELLKLAALKVIEVPIPELGGAKIKLRELSTSQAQSFFADIAAIPKEGDQSGYISLTVKVFCLTAIDDDGTRLFGDDEFEEVANLIPLNIASRLGAEALKHSKLSEESKKEHQAKVSKNSRTPKRASGIGLR